LAQGNYTLRVSSTIPEYIQIDRSIYVSACSHTILPDTIRLRSLGVPIVSGIQVFEDTAVGTIKLIWEKTSHRDMLDYLLYREQCEAKDFVHEPLRVTHDTFSIDSIYVPLPADLSDTVERCLRYWIAVRTNGQEIGTAYKYTEWRLAPKSYIMTSLSHGMKNFLRECDSASANDTIFASVKAWNRTRPLRSVCWFDPEKKDTVSRTRLHDRLHREIKDTIRYSFQSLGVHHLVAIAEDYAGNIKTETVPIKIVPDIPVADAGGDTGVFTAEKVHLHGRAYQQFGEIIVWKWKIGDGEWKRISGPDTTIMAPSVEKTVICSLEVFDEDGNRSVDAMKIITSFKVKSISAGSFHSLILKADGSCWAFGLNDAGQLGDGGKTAQFTPVKIMSDVKRIAAGGSQSLFLKNDGILWACGNNDSGRLGDGTGEARFVPVKIMENVQDMSAGDKHSLILKTDNTLWACGENDSGQLGDGTNTSKLSPVQVLTDAKLLAAGGRHSLVIKTDGVLWACGKNRSGQLGNETSDDLNLFTRIMDGVAGIAAGDRHSMFLKNDGSLLASGNNWYGQLGDNSGGRRLAPALALNDVHAIGAGTGFSLAVKIDGSLWVFGKDSFGQLGIGAARDTNTTPVRLMDDVETVTAGANHSLVLKIDGSL
jgi:alpha-tubulin suppressor-like RCC1 family protein